MHVKILYKFGVDHTATRYEEFESVADAEAEVLQNLNKTIQYVDNGGVTRIINGSHVKEVKVWGMPE